MGMIRCWKIGIVSLFMMLIPTLLIASQLSQTKENLATLEKKIQHMQKRLAQVQDKQSLLKQEITDIEKRIHGMQPQLQITERKYHAKQQEIATLKTQLDALNEKYQEMQTSLTKLIVARYKMADKKAVIALLQQPKTQTSQRLFVYYRYLLQTNQHLMENLKKTQQGLIEKKEILDHEFQTLANLQTKLKRDQEKLSADQSYRTTLIQSLNQEIHQTQQNIAAFRQSQIHLTHLMTTLNQQSVLQTRHPLSQMKHKLIRPIEGNTSERNTNQGVLFASAEEAPVQAIYPGKVVFSDWLNAYGLLIIVDHGWGFMTLYANNQAIFKHKGDTVNQGERIASVGHSGAFRQNGLYFEIRHRGKAVPPLQWLR